MENMHKFQNNGKRNINGQRDVIYVFQIKSNLHNTDYKDYVRVVLMIKRYVIRIVKKLCDYCVNIWIIEGIDIYDYDMLCYVYNVMLY